MYNSTQYYYIHAITQNDKMKKEKYSLLLEVRSNLEEKKELKNKYIYIYIFVCTLRHRFKFHIPTSALRYIGNTVYHDKIS